MTLMLCYDSDMIFQHFSTPFKWAPQTLLELAQNISKWPMQALTTTLHFSLIFFNHDTLEAWLIVWSVHFRDFGPSQASSFFVRNGCPACTAKWWRALTNQKIPLATRSSSVRWIMQTFAYHSKCSAATPISSHPSKALILMISMIADFFPLKDPK